MRKVKLLLSLLVLAASVTALAGNTMPVELLLDQKVVLEIASPSYFLYMIEQDSWWAKHTYTDWLNDDEFQLTLIKFNTAGDAEAYLEYWKDCDTCVGWEQKPGSTPNTIIFRFSFTGGFIMEMARWDNWITYLAYEYLPALTAWELVDKQVAKLVSTIGPK